MMILLVGSADSAPASLASVGRQEQLHLIVMYHTARSSPNVWYMVTEIRLQFKLFDLLNYRLNVSEGLLLGVVTVRQ